MKITSTTLFFLLLTISGFCSFTERSNDGKILSNVEMVQWIIDTISYNREEEIDNSLLQHPSCFFKHQPE